MSGERINANAESAVEKKRRAWEQKLHDMERIVDRLNNPMDEGIKQTVTALQLFGYTTIGSCEGHADGGLPYPWVQMTADGEPEYRYEGEKAVRAEILTELGFQPEEVVHGSPKYDFNKWEQYQIESNKRISLQPETEEYTAWTKMNQEVTRQVKDLIGRFYGSEGETLGPRVSTNFVGAYQPRLIIDDEQREADENRVFELARDAVMPSDDLVARLRDRQAEMQRFTKFLKRDFFKSS